MAGFEPDFAYQGLTVDYVKKKLDAYSVSERDDDTQNRLEPKNLIDLFTQIDYTHVARKYVTDKKDFLINMVTEILFFVISNILLI